MKTPNFDLKRFFSSSSLQNWQRKLPKLDLRRLSNMKAVRQVMHSKAYRQFSSTKLFGLLQQNKVACLAGGAALAGLMAIGTIRAITGVGQQPSVAATPTEQTPSTPAAVTEQDTAVEVVELDAAPPAPEAVAASEQPTATTPSASATLTTESATPATTNTTTKQVSVTTQAATEIPEELPFEILEVDEPVPTPQVATKTPDPNALEIIDLQAPPESSTGSATTSQATSPPVDPEQAKLAAAAEKRKNRKFNRIEVTLMKHPEQEAKARKYGRMLTQLGEYERGERFYLWYLKSHPHDGEAFFGLGWHYQTTKQWANACKAYQRAADLDSEHEAARNNLAWILATCPDDSVRDGPRAIKVATEANSLLKWPKASIAITLAAAYAEAGDFRAAIRIQKWAIRSATAEEKVALMQTLDLYRSKQPLRME